MRDDGTHEAVCLLDIACHRVEFASDRPRGAGPTCKDELYLGGWERDEIEGGSWTGAPWERLVDFVVGARL